MSWYLEVLQKYAVFSGRARRKEYWFFILFNIIISIVLSAVDGMIGSSLIPLIGAIVLLVFMVQDSQEGDNQYGPNPKRDIRTTH